MSKEFRFLSPALSRGQSARTVDDGTLSINIVSHGAAGAHLDRYRAMMADVAQVMREHGYQIEGHCGFVGRIGMQLQPQFVVEDSPGECDHPRHRNLGLISPCPSCSAGDDPGEEE